LVAHFILLGTSSSLLAYKRRGTEANAAFIKERERSSQKEEVEAPLLLMVLNYPPSV